MLIQRLPATYNRRSALITLQNEAEMQLTRHDLLRICDNMAGVKYNHESDSYALTGEDFGPDNYFGGSVEETNDPLTKRVTVYTD